MTLAKQPCEQWEFRVVAYEIAPQNGAYFYRAFGLIINGAEIEGLERLSGQGETPALAIADLFTQVHQLEEK